MSGAGQAGVGRGRPWRPRDRYIAAQIDATLQAEGEVGLLFMGALHRAAGYLPKDIETVRLHGR